MCCQIKDALDRRLVRSSACLSALDHRQYARAHVTVLKTQGAAGEAIIAKATQALWADKACARSCPLGSSALARAKSSLFALLSTF